MQRFILSFPFEAIAWITGLTALALLDPTTDTHVTICPLANLGFQICPGCGLGRAISFLFHGEFLKSFQSHPLGIVAVIILSYRIFELFKQHIKYHGKSYRSVS